MFTDPDSDQGYKNEMVEISGKEYNVETWELTYSWNKLRVTRKVKIADRILHFGFEIRGKK